MAIVGSRKESFAMRGETTRAAQKVLDAGWRVSTGGGGRQRTDSPEYN